MEKVKICFVCGIEQSLSQFYKHKQMADGHLNKCKTCAKAQAKANEISNRKDPVWVEKEKVRARERYNRLGYREKQLEWDSDKPWKATSSYKNLNRDLKRKKLIKNGFKAHHWSYEDINLRDIFIVSAKVHKKIHKHIIFENSLRIFSYNGLLLDSKTKHYSAILDIILLEKIKEDILSLNLPF